MNSNEPNQTHVEADEKHLLLDHNYDGIQELNHPLPSWWNLIFYISIAFSVVYFVYYQLMSGPSLKDEFKKEHEKTLALQAEFKKQNGLFNSDHYAAIIADDGVKKGALVYETNCLACHAENGKGDVGPNLTDEYWIRAKGTPESIYDVAFNGSEENGMPAWAELISKDEIYQAVAYIMTLKNTNVKGGKAPQGEKVVQIAE